MSAQDYSRPVEGLRFIWGGVKLNATPDNLPPEKYASAVNIRSSSRQSLKTRPGYAPKFITGGNSVTDLKSYATLGTDDLPRYLARDSVNGIYLDTGSLEATLSGTPGYGVSMVPFRPGASPQSWMYIAGLGDYKKFSAPDSSNIVTVQKVGVAEPQQQVEAATNAPKHTQFQSLAASWTAGGTAGALTDSTLLSDTVGAAVLNDPIVSTRQSVQVTIPWYAPGMMITVNASAHLPVEEVWQACAACTISAIRYDSGTSGLCSIVPSIDLSTTIGRGSLVQLNASETVLVLSVTAGDNGASVFRCSTVGTFTAGQAIAGVLAIVVHGTVAPGDAITIPSIHSSITTGSATMSEAVGAGVFSAYSQDDYIYVTLLLQDIASVASVSFIFNVGSSVDYSTAILTYTVTGASLVPNVVAGEVVVISFPISSLGNKPGALNPCNGFRIQVDSTSAQAVTISGLWVGGGSLPDVGNDGAPYFFRAVPRSSLTGARGNATPPMRYGVTPRRQSVTVTVPSAAYDTQIDIWDFYATGGTTTQYGYVGSVSVGSSSTFTFNSFDSAIIAAIANGNVLQVQNYEPWPSIDIPWKATTGGGITIVAIGSYITVDGVSPWPSLIARWLPGTLITLSGLQTFTLRSRPVASGSAYIFEVQEVVGAQSPSTITVPEPAVANQPLPYVWGPDAYGVIFGNGDPLRPGTQYFTQAYTPDSAPQPNTLELTSPDKPLCGGVVVGGLSIVASSLKWWALYPNLGTGGYSPVEWTVGRPAVAPYGIVTDGTAVYFWTKDGIAKTAGQGYESLTDDDLYSLFPHEGIPGENVVQFGYIYRAPDYSRVATFRLAIFNGFLYADYQDSTGTPRTLVCDLHTKAWCADSYGDSITCHYGVEQQAGALTGAPSRYDEMLLASAVGKVYAQADLHNDDSTPIAAQVQTFEFDGGDIRAFEQWGDQYLDSLPSAPITVTPLTLASPIASPTVVPASASRAYTPISVGGSTIQNTLGMALSWTDDFSVRVVATHLYVWQPQFTPWPVLSQADSPWMNVQPGGAAAFLQGLLIPMETGGTVPVLSVRTDLSPAPISLVATRTPLPNVKTPIPFALATPVICHQVQIVRGAICRLWLDEVSWVSEATPEAALTWATQLTSHGMPGYHSIIRIEAAYAAGADVSLTIAAFDGTAPAVITLPSTGGAKQRVLLTPTFNKAKLYSYGAVSGDAFQIFASEWIVYVAPWNRKSGAVAYRLLGGAFDDKAVV